MKEGYRDLFWNLGTANPCRSRLTVEGQPKRPTNPQTASGWRRRNSENGLPGGGGKWDGGQTVFNLSTLSSIDSIKGIADKALQVASCKPSRSTQFLEARGC